MSDFITSLVDRALGRAPVLERRQASVFEPLVEGVFTESAATEERTKPAGVHERTASRPGISRLPGNTEKTFAFLEAIHTNDELPQSQPIAQPPLRLSEIRSEVESVSPSFEEEQPAPHTFQAAPVIVSQTRDVIPLSSHAIETIVERKVASSPFVAEHDNDESHVVNLPVANPEPSHSDTYIVVGEQHHSVETKQADVTGVAPRPATSKLHQSRRRQVPIGSMHRTESVDAIAEQPVPTVNVTIGRVEVRATTHPQRAHPARPAGPKLNLEDYLRSRGKRN